VSASEVRSVCPYCGVGCGILATVHGGRMTALRGDPGERVWRGQESGVLSRGNGSGGNRPSP